MCLALDTAIVLLLQNKELFDVLTCTLCWPAFGLLSILYIMSDVNLLFS